MSLDQITLALNNTALPLGGAASPMTQSGIYNLNSSSLLHWRTAMARVRTGTGRGRVLFLSDSTGVGTGSGTGAGQLTGAFVKSWPQQTAKLLTSGGLTTSVGNITGDGNTSITTTYNLYDPRVTLGASWAAVGVNGPGGLSFGYGGGAVNNFAFTPVASFDTIGIFFAANPGNGTATVNVDGGSSLGTLNTNVTQAFGAQAFSCTAGTHTLNIVPSANGNVTILAIVTYLSTTSAVDILNGSANAAFVSTFTQTNFAWAGIAMFAGLLPDLTVIALTVNDSNAGNSLATYASGIQSLITAAKGNGGDVLLMTGPPSNTIQATNGQLAQYIAAMQNLALINNCPMLSIVQRWTSFAVTNASMPYSDTLHPQALGYSDIGLAVSEVLLNA